MFGTGLKYCPVCNFDSIYVDSVNVHKAVGLHTRTRRARGRAASPRPTVPTLGSLEAFPRLLSPPGDQRRKPDEGYGRENGAEFDEQPDEGPGDGLCDRERVGIRSVEVGPHGNLRGAHVEGDDAFAVAERVRAHPFRNVRREVIAHVDVDEVPPAGACGDDDRTRATRVLSAGPVVHHAVRVVDVKLDTDAGVRIHGELLAALVVVVMGFEDQIDLATEEEIHDVLSDLAPVLARGDAVLVHPDEDPRNARCTRSEEHTSELQSQFHLVCRLLLEKKKK